jgi:hypothetical protein
MYSGAASWYERLAVDCPLSQRDVSNGTYRINVVRTAMYRGARQLEALARGRSIEVCVCVFVGLFGGRYMVVCMYSFLPNLLNPEP